MVQAQEWLDQNYPKETRERVIKLDISSKNLERNLDLNDFVNLNELVCSDNLISGLDISGCFKLRKIDCHNNKLTKLNWGKNLEIEELICDGNKQLNNISLPLKIEEQSYLGLVNKEHRKAKKKCQGWKAHKYGEKSSIENLKVGGSLSFFRRKKSHIKITDFNHSLQELKVQDWREDQQGFKSLKKTLEKTNNDLDIYEIIKQFGFFDFRTGSFHGDLNNLLFFFNLNQEETYFLKKTIETLTKEIKSYKQKIVNAYCSFAPEKELLKGLINTELDYRKTKEQKLPSRKLEKQLNKLKDELEEKIGEEQMEEVENILTDCNNLVRSELELENKINTNKLIEDLKEHCSNFYITVKDCTFSNNQGNIMVGVGQISDNTNISYNNKRPRRDSWEESSTTRNKIGELTLMEIEEQELITQQEIPPKSK